jgi:hypothetical protein
MGKNLEFISTIRKAGKQKLLFLPHCIRQMSRPDRMISVKDIKQVIGKGKIIEDYPEDPRGHSCLINGKVSEGRNIHLVCAPKDDYLALITAYIPSAEEWNNDYSERTQQ